MDESTNREKVLKKIRTALLAKTDNPYPKVSFDSNVYKTTDEDLLLVFAEKAEAAGAKFFLIENELEFMEALVNLGAQYKWKNIVCVEDGLSNLLTECELPHHISTDHTDIIDVAVSTCECMIARTGSIVISSKVQSRNAPAYTPIHIILGKSSQITQDLKDAISWIRYKYPKLPSSVNIITGPGRTADIEGKAIIGAHGPKQVYVFVIDDREI
ncbi:MAG: LUD domain-containing protein [Bacteroidetes bacterium]|nr:LUD domain-containing protein [Bacteroidota bacterium]